MLPVLATPTTSANPWDRRAPEREGPPSAWSLLPADLVARGCPGRPEHVFSRLQKVRTWQPDRLFLSREIRAWLAENTDLSLPTILERYPSADGATKIVLGLTDGHRVEAIHMPRRQGDHRVMFCVSSQVGCALGCTFCATGAMGIVRNLTAGEIVGQVLALMRDLGPRGQVPKSPRRRVGGPGPRPQPRPGAAARRIALSRLHGNGRAAAHPRPCAPRHHRALPSRGEPALAVAHHGEHRRPRPRHR